MQHSMMKRINDHIPGYRLFFKIFLWFWLTVVVVVATVLLRSHVGRIHMVGPPNMYATVAPLIATEAVKVYETGGAEAFLRFSRSSVSGEDRKLYLLDGFYKDVAGRDFSSRGLEVARATKTGQLWVLHDEIAGYRVISSSGHPYVLLLYLNEPWHGVWLTLFTSGETFLAGVILFTTILCVWLAYHIASPVYAIQNAARRVTRGDLNARSPMNILRRHDELAALAVDFNLMVDRIQLLLDSHKQLLASVSHELRSPLTRLSVSMAILRKHKRDDSEETLQRMDRDINLIDDLMGQLLTLSRFEAGPSGARLGRVDVGELLLEVGADCDFEARASGKSVDVAIRDRVVFAQADMYALRSACENIVRNAMRFTAPETCVRVGLAIEQVSSEREAVITVCDNGPGVPEDMLESIFKPFVRVRQDTFSNANVGLGLAIATGAVELHRGTISAANLSGSGLEITIRLPLEANDEEETSTATSTAGNPTA